MGICKALVENGVVVDAHIIEDIPFPNDIYAPELEFWITAPLEVGVGWLHDGEAFIPPSIEG